MAYLVIISKVDVAAIADVQKVRENITEINPEVKILMGYSPIELDDPEVVRDHCVLVGPTTTHGGMSYGAGYIAATRANVAEIIDPRNYAVPEIAAVYELYPHIGKILPAMGYFPAQLAALETTINRTPADVVISATPIDLASLIKVNKPIIRARYEFAEGEDPGLGDYLKQFLTSILP